MINLVFGVESVSGADVWRCGRGAKMLNWVTDLQNLNRACVSSVLPLHILLAGRL